MNDNRLEKTIYPNRLKVVLSEKELPNRWLAEKFGLCQVTGSRWTTNMTQPSVSQLIEIAKFLNVTLEDLMEPYN